MGLFAPAVQRGTGQRHRHRNEPESALDATAQGSGCPQAQGTDALTQVALEAVDANRRSTPAGVGILEPLVNPSLVLRYVACRLALVV